ATQVDPLRSYRAELPVEELDPRGELVDWLIGYTFDTLDAHKLTLRIAPPESERGALERGAQAWEDTQ
ncbi:MAG: hypothetical protein DIU80_022145, partial [Chloroflexota bacterium]